MFISTMQLIKSLYLILLHLKRNNTRLCTKLTNKRHHTRKSLKPSHDLPVLTYQFNLLKQWNNAHLILFFDMIKAHSSSNNTTLYKYPPNTNPVSQIIILNKFAYWYRQVKRSPYFDKRIKKYTSKALIVAFFRLLFYFFICSLVTQRFTSFRQLRP